MSGKYDKLRHPEDGNLQPLDATAEPEEHPDHMSEEDIGFVLTGHSDFETVYKSRGDIRLINPSLRSIVLAGLVIFVVGLLTGRYAFPFIPPSHETSGVNGVGTSTDITPPTMMPTQQPPSEAKKKKSRMGAGGDGGHL